MQKIIEKTKLRILYEKNYVPLFRFSEEYK